MDAAHAPGAGRQTVIAVFESLGDAERALAALRALGVPREDISLVLRDAPDAADGLDGAEGIVVSGAATGATIGGLIGGLAGWLLVSLVPGIGPVLGAGLLASTLTSAAIGAAGGGILGALLGLGVAEDEALAYAEHVQAGRVLLTVSAATPAAVQQFVHTLEAENAYDVRTYAGAGPSAAANTPPAAPAVVTPAPVPPDPVPALPASVPPAPATASTTPEANAVAVPSPAAGGGAGMQSPALEATPAATLEPAPPVAAAPQAPLPPPPQIGGDVAAAISGGPDVRGAMGQSAIADRGLTDATPDPAASAWRSGGDAARPPDAAAERGASGLESAAPLGVGDVVAALNDGPDVAPPQVTAGLESVGPAGENAAGTWADAPSDWRSGGEAARADSGDGVGVAPVSGDRSLSTATLEAAPAPDAAAGYYASPGLLSRSALGAGGPTNTARGATALEGAAPVERGYGDADTE